MAGEQAADASAAAGAGRAAKHGAYDAFISYSHAMDGRLAPALQRGLHAFAKPWYRVRAVRVFRDDASLSANPALWTSIETALESSRFFVLLASPGAAASEWVAQEVSFWLAHKPRSNLLVALTSGEIAWDDAAGDYDWARTTALPQRLAGAYDEEPRFIDLRWTHEATDISLRNPRFRELVADIAAPLHGRPKDELIGEDVRQHRRTIRIARAAGTGLAALAIAAASLAVVAVLKQREATRQRDQALSRELAASSIGALTVDPELALLLGIASADKAPTSEAATALRRALGESHVRVVIRPRAGLGATALSPDGTTIATFGGDGVVRLWNRRTGRQLHAFPAGREGRFLAFSADGRLLAAAGESHGVRLWRIADGRRLHVIDAGELNDLRFSRDGRRLVTASDDGTIVWSVASGRAIARPDVEAGTAEFSPDGTRVLTTESPDALGEARIWSAATGRRLGGTSDDLGIVYGGRWLPDGRRFVVWGDSATVRSAADARVAADLGTHGTVLETAITRDGKLLAAGDDGTLRLFRLRDGKQLGAVAGAAVLVSAFNRDGTLLATGGTDGAARVWSTSPLRQLAVLRGHTATVTYVAFTSDGRFVVTSGDVAGDGTVRVWQAVSSDELAHIGGAPESLRPIALSRDGRLVASTGTDVAPQIFDTRTGALRRALRGVHKNTVESIAFSPDGKTVATGDDERAVLWDVATGEHRRLARQVGYVTGVDFSPDGRRVVATTNGGTAVVSSVATGEMRAVLKAPPRYFFYRAVFSPDGTKIATDGSDGRVRIWSRSGKRLLVLPRKASATPAGPVLFDPSGDRVVVAHDGTATIWDAETGRQLHVLRPHAGDVTDVAFSPDGRLVATAQDNGSIHLWNAGSGRDAGVLSEHSGRVESVAFSRDGRLVSASDDGTARVWDVSAGAAIAVFRTSGAVNQAVISRDGSLVATGGDDGIHVFSCRLCGTLDELRAKARSLVTRRLTHDERRRYLHQP